MTLFLKLVTIVFGIFFLINLMRVLPLFRDLYAKGVKPLSCDVCMAFWAVLTLVVISYLRPGLPDALSARQAFPVMGGALALLRAFPQHPSAPPSLRSE